MLFYSCIFTTADNKPNEYMYMSMILYASLVKSKSLTANDSYCILCDTDSATILKNIPILNKIQLLVLPKPKTILEGMLWRYQLYKYMDITNKDCMYLDVDMICIKETHFNIHPDSFLVFPEGSPTDSNYCGDMALTMPYGCTSGFFGYNCGHSVIHTFERILNSVNVSEPKKYYTLDQPYFNKALEGKTVYTMPEYILSFNGHTNRATAHFINCCGDPGDGPLHFTKMLQILLM